MSPEDDNLQDVVSGNQLNFYKYIMLFQAWNWYRDMYTIKSTIDAVKFSNAIKLSPSKVIMRIDMYCHIIYQRT
jgi:hypothetical protein